MGIWTREGESNGVVARVEQRIWKLKSLGQVGNASMHPLEFSFQTSEPPFLLPVKTESHRKAYGEGESKAIDRLWSAVALSLMTARGLRLWQIHPPFLLSSSPQRHEDTA